MWLDDGMTTYTAPAISCAKANASTTDPITVSTRVPVAPGSLYCSAEGGATYEVDYVEEWSTIAPGSLSSDTPAEVTVVGYRYSHHTKTRGTIVRGVDGAHSFRTTPEIPHP